MRTTFFDMVINGNIISGLNNWEYLGKLRVYTDIVIRNIPSKYIQSHAQILHWPLTYVIISGASWVIYASGRGVARTWM